MIERCRELYCPHIRCQKDSGHADSHKHEGLTWDNRGTFKPIPGICLANVSKNDPNLLCILQKGHSGDHQYKRCNVVRENGRDPSVQCLREDGHEGAHKFPMTEYYSHYIKDVSGLQKLDVYRVLELFEVKSPAIQHAIKKLLVAGGRGVKDAKKDVAEAIVSLKRWEEMQAELER